MQTAACLLSILLAGQPPANRPTATPAKDDDATEARPLVPVTAPQARLTPSRLMAAALTPPAREPLAGRPLGLPDVLTRASGRARQLDAVRAYWNLSAAVGEYHFAREEYEQLDELSTTVHAAHADRAKHQSLARNQLALEVSAAAARLREAELKALAAQSDLAGRLALSPADPPPLPLDLPNLRSYNTYFEVLFASRPAPPRLRLLDRTLPLRYKAVETRAEAVQASLDGFEAASDAYQAGETGADAVALRMIEVARQRRAFLAAVRDYNEEIAEYALTVAGESAAPAAVLPMLIRPTVSGPANGAASSRAGAGNTPGSEAEADAQVPLQSLPGRRTPDQGVPPAKSQVPNKPKPDAGEARSLLSPESRTATSPNSSTRLKPPSSLSLDDIFRPAHQADVSEHAMYAGLMALSAPKRTHRLTSLLHWDRALKATSGKAATLNECLAPAAGPQRGRIVSAYWKAREQAARYQVLTDRHDQLATLLPIALTHASQPGGAEAMLHLRAAELAAQADLLDAEAALWSAKLELTSTQRAPAAADSWLLPSTPPHGGRYELKTSLQPKPVVESPLIRSLTATIPSLHAVLADRAETVIRSDSQRAAATQAFEAGQPVASHVLAAIERQCDESLAFLTALTRYNQAIADYALNVLPPSTGAVQLTAALVVVQR